MAEDNFSKFKKRYKDGKIPTVAMPPVPGAPGVGVARTLGTAAARSGMRWAKDAYDKAQKAAARNAKRREARAEKKAERAKEKFGPLVKREENVPATQGSRALVKREDKLPAKRAEGSRSLAVVREGKGDLQKYNPGGRSVATQGTRTFGDKGGGKGAGMKTNLKRAGAALLVGGAAYGLYKGADKPKADQGGTSSNAAAKTDRESKAAAFKAKQQGMKTPGSPTNPNTKSATPKKAGDKSRMSKGAPEKKMTNFERMKMRGYEKEGLGGRSMTSAKAKERVKTERGYKFKDLFKKK